MEIRVQAAPFDMGAELNRFSTDIANAGAVVSFTGIVRDLATGNLDVMEIEHYPGMTEKALTSIAEDAQSRWNLAGCLIIHRYGLLAPNDPIMMVATAAPHRTDAFAAAEFLMDFLKSRAPFWKKEITSDRADWVQAKEVDEDALTRWNKSD